MKKYLIVAVFILAVTISGGAVFLIHQILVPIQKNFFLPGRESLNQNKSLALQAEIKRDLSTEIEKPDQLFKAERQRYLLEIASRFQSRTEEIKKKQEVQEVEYLFIENDDGEIVKSDITVAAGAAAIYRYFKEDGINAPLYNYGEIFVTVSQKLRLDWRLLPAIAMQESTGGKYMFRPYNAFGFGQHDFESHEEAIQTVGKALAGILSPNYQKWYGGKNIQGKLRTYNSVRNTYVEEVMWIMRAISRAHERNKAESQ